MKRRQFFKRYREVLNQINYALIEKAKKALDSGCIDLEHAEDNYRLPKNVLCAVLRDAANEIKPIRRADVREINNIYKHI